MNFKTLKITFFPAKYRRGPH